jgi:hypothetical protein
MTTPTASRPTPHELGHRRWLEAWDKAVRVRFAHALAGWLLLLVATLAVFGYRQTITRWPLRLEVLLGVAVLHFLNRRYAIRHWNAMFSQAWRVHDQIPPG